MAVNSKLRSSMRVQCGKRLDTATWLPQGTQLFIRSFELGVMFLPSLESHYRQHPHRGFTCTPREAPPQSPSSDPTIDLPHPKIITPDPNPGLQDPGTSAADPVSNLDKPHAGCQVVANHSNNMLSTLSALTNTDSVPPTLTCISCFDEKVGKACSLRRRWRSAYAKFAEVLSCSWVGSPEILSYKAACQGAGFQGMLNA